MKTQDLIKELYQVPKGFKVNYTYVKKGSCLGESNYFPEGELIPHEEIAWAWAALIAKASKEYVHIYVVDHTNSPVKDYKGRIIENRDK